MAETISEKETCGSCGVDVREDTLFCYNCGKRVTFGPTVDGSAMEVTSGTSSVLKPEVATSDPDEDMVRRFSIEDEPAGDKLANAAAERRKARISRKKPREVVWESADESSNGLFVLITLLITAMVVVIVFVAVYLK